MSSDTLSSVNSELAAVCGDDAFMFVVFGDQSGGRAGLLCRIKCAG